MAEHMYDCIVVGAGPAGSTVAYNLAKHHKRVLVLERYTFPKYKPCSGGVTAKTYKALDFPIDGLIKSRSKNIILAVRHKRYRKICLCDVITYMVARKEFDLYLAQKAREQGASILEGTKTYNIKYDGKLFSLETSAGKFESAYLVGADGANSFVNRSLKIVPTDVKAFAVEIHHPAEPEIAARYQQTFELGIVPHGHLWIFSHQASLSIGAYTTSAATAKDLKQYLRDYLHKLGFHNYDEKEIRGHIIPSYGINYRQPPLPCILVGDAGGFCDYLSGEGIFYAMKTAKIASEVICMSLRDNHFYHDVLQRKYDREIIRGLRLAFPFGKIFYSHPAAVFNLITTHFIARILFTAALKGFTYDEVIMKSPSLLWKSLFKPFRIRKMKGVAQ